MLADERGRRHMFITVEVGRRSRPTTTGSTTETDGIHWPPDSPCDADGDGSDDDGDSWPLSAIAPNGDSWPRPPHRR